MNQTTPHQKTAQGHPAHKKTGINQSSALLSSQRTHTQHPTHQGQNIRHHTKTTQHTNTQTTGTRTPSRPDTPNTTNQPPTRQIPPPNHTKTDRSPRESGGGISINRYSAGQFSDIVTTANDFLPRRKIN